MQATIVPPGYVPRGLAVIGEPPPPRPAPVIVTRPVPYGDDPPPEVRFGLPLWAYVLSHVFASVMAVVIAVHAGVSGGVLGGAPVIPLVAPVLVLWCASFAGLLDYARRGARP